MNGDAPDPRELAAFREVVLSRDTDRYVIVSHDPEVADVDPVAATRAIGPYTGAEAVAALASLRGIYADLGLDSCTLQLIPCERPS